MPIRTVSVAAAAIACATLAACTSGRGSSTATRSPTPAATTSSVAASASPTVSLAAYAHQYETVIAAANTAIGKLNTVAVKPNATAATLQPTASRTASAIQAADNKLLRVAWPTVKIRDDVDAMVRTDATFIGDLDDVADNLQNMQRDAAAASGAANIVRADLGLPPTTPG